MPTKKAGINLCKPSKYGICKKTFLSNTLREQPVSGQLSFKINDLTRFAILDEIIFKAESFLLFLIPDTNLISSLVK